jgi:uncharacterized protein
VGSDVDLVVLVEATDQPFHRRQLGFDIRPLPVPADLLLYTIAEWDQMSLSGGLPNRVAAEVVWVFER